MNIYIYKDLPLQGVNCKDVFWWTSHLFWETTLVFIICHKPNSPNNKPQHGNPKYTHPAPIRVYCIFLLHGHLQIFSQYNLL